MRQDLAPGQLRHWKEELNNYTDDEIIVALGLYKGEFFPSVKQIKEIIERKRQLVGEEQKRKEWDRWKQAHQQGKLATAEEIRQMVRECAEIWAQAEREGRLVSSGRPNGRDVRQEAHGSKGLAKAPAAMADSKGAKL